MKQLPDDFKDFLKLLNENRVRYLVVGGYAVNYYGYPRSTGDLDIWIDSTKDNAKLTLKAITEFGFINTGLKAEDFLITNKIFRMGHPPLRIEVLTGVSGIKFGECYDRAIKEVIEGVQVSLISLKDLKTNKAAAGRAKDKEDLENL